MGECPPTHIDLGGSSTGKDQELVVATNEGGSEPPASGAPDVVNGGTEPEYDIDSIDEVRIINGVCDRFSFPSPFDLTKLTFSCVGS